VLLLPGIGTVEDLELAASKGADVLRIATHVTEADVSAEHFDYATDMGLEANGLLMLSHMADPETVLEQASLMEEYGADAVYVMDSAGALLPDGVRERVSLLDEELSIDVGFHAHNNLGLGIGNTLAGLDAGAVTVDGCLRGPARVPATPRWRCSLARSRRPATTSAPTCSGRWTPPPTCWNRC